MKKDSTEQAGEVAGQKESGSASIDYSVLQPLSSATRVCENCEHWGRKKVQNVGGIRMGVCYKSGEFLSTFVARLMGVSGQYTQLTPIIVTADKTFCQEFEYTTGDTEGKEE